MRKLGHHQKAVLEIFAGITTSNGDIGDGTEVRYGQGGKVYYGTNSELRRILWSLEDRGLVEWYGSGHSAEESVLQNFSVLLG